MKDGGEIAIFCTDFLVDDNNERRQKSAEWGQGQRFCGDAASKTPSFAVPWVQAGPHQRRRAAAMAYLYFTAFKICCSYFYGPQ